ncbi:urocanate hydratase [Schleiferia thermophila]|uniref:urocanate hydratase n=1 Tax=Schleiferia thermophila TaxID=884107 RepID=UPI0004E6D547|nr:urocanate hydratase [Schleiferia thermophila]KFD38261.1 urocanate hydratase [Schleiferia thermophila str. Yellowstone]
MSFAEQILRGIPEELPAPKPYDPTVNHAPKRRNILTVKEEELALKNALRYFHPRHHGELLPEFYDELRRYGRIYMYRFRPDYEMYARPIEEYPHKSLKAAAIMLMIQNNLDPRVAQHPHELITYGGNGAVFQNWAQYLLTMKYLATMTDQQTLHMYSGHPMGLFPSSEEAPRVVVTNGMMIPNYSTPDDYDRYNAIGVTQYGQMTAGSYMYIGSQGIVHGTYITVLNALRKVYPDDENPAAGRLFVTAGLGGMSGAQPKAAKIAGCVSVTAEVNPKPLYTRYEQGWVDVVVTDISTLCKRVKEELAKKSNTSFAYLGNVVEVWDAFLNEGIYVDIGSDQTSLHNPYAGGYYPYGLTFEEANQMMADDPERFRSIVNDSLRQHVDLINQHTARGTYFFDYGNAFLLMASRVNADIMAENGEDFRYPSYVQDIMGPMCFDFGFGPFRWVCTSGRDEDLKITDSIARDVLERIYQHAPVQIRMQLRDNIYWIENAWKNRLVVGSKARILYADSEGRIEIARAFNRAVKEGKIGPVVLGRDHHDVSGTDSPYRETSNIYDGSAFTADMAIHNVIGDSFRGATWVSIHNGGGVGWGEVINGGFGLLLDGSAQAERALQNMLFFDVNNGIARRSWARNPNAMFSIQREMKRRPELTITIPHMADDAMIRSIVQANTGQAQLSI